MVSTRRGEVWEDATKMQGKELQKKKFYYFAVRIVLLMLTA